MVEATGKTRAEAVARALAKLGIREQEASVTVVEERRARWFGLFGGPEVRVRVTRRAGPTSELLPGDASDVERVREVVAGILKTMQIEARVRVDGGGRDRRVVVETDGSDGLLIGRHGQTLAALEHIANRILTRGRDNRPLVSVDIAGYRSRGQAVDGEERPEPRARAAAGRGRQNRRARAGARG